MVCYIHSKRKYKSELWIQFLFCWIPTPFTFIFSVIPFDLLYYNIFYICFTLPIQCLNLKIYITWAFTTYTVTNYMDLYVNMTKILFSLIEYFLKCLPLHSWPEIFPVKLCYRVWQESDNSLKDSLQTL